MKISTIVRFVLSLAIVYGVFTETGIWTSVAMFLMFGFAEITSWVIKKRI